MPLTVNQAYDLLESAQERGRLGHAFLITGAKGVGKKELAARLISLINAPKSVDTGESLFGDEMPAPPVHDSVMLALEEMQSEFVRIVKPRSKSRIIRVEEMRELEDSFYMSAPEGQWKVGVVIDADRMNEAAANAFLKTLEEPPRNSLLLLLTSAPDRLLTTILSRCISISLFDPAGSSMSVLEEQMHDMVQKNYQRENRSLATALSLKVDFDTFLKEQKEMLAKQYKKALKDEVEILKKASAEREFLKEKEERNKAEEASEYLALRTDSINALITWFGDLIRWQVGHSPAVFTGGEEVFARFTEGLTLYDLLQRMESLEELRFLLTETNVSEALALETSFMKCFG